MEEKVTIQEETAFRKRYALRRAYKDGKTLETVVPWIVAEREARRLGLTVDEFLECYEVECLFNDFPGLHYRFVPKE